MNEKEESTKGGTVELKMGDPVNVCEMLLDAGVPWGDIGECMMPRMDGEAVRAWYEDECKRRGREPMKERKRRREKVTS